MAEGDIYAGVVLRYWTQTQFDDNPLHRLLAGQFVFLAGTDKFKRGDGVTVLSALPWRGNVWGLISGTISDQADLTTAINNAVVPPIISGHWRGWPGSGPMTGGAWNGFIRTLPYIVGSPHTVTQVRLAVSAGVASENIRLAIYNDDGAGLPGTLIEDSGNLSAASAGEVSFTFTTPRALTGKLIHIAFQASHTSIAVRSWTTGPFFMPRTGGAAPYISRRATQAFGAFPTPFPASTEVGTGNQFMAELLVQ